MVFVRGAPLPAIRGTDTSDRGDFSARLPAAALQDGLDMPRRPRQRSRRSGGGEAPAGVDLPRTAGGGGFGNSRPRSAFDPDKAHLILEPLAELPRTAANVSSGQPVEVFGSRLHEPPTFTTSRPDGVWGGSVALTLTSRSASQPSGAANYREPDGIKAEPSGVEYVEAVDGR
jgi:hypothetical protein